MVGCVGEAKCCGTVACYEECRVRWGDVDESWMALLSERRGIGLVDGLFGQWSPFG